MSGNLKAKQTHTEGGVAEVIRVGMRQRVSETTKQAQQETIGAKMVEAFVMEGSRIGDWVPKHGRGLISIQCMTHGKRWQTRNSPMMRKTHGSGNLQMPRLTAEHEIDIPISLSTWG